MKEANRLQLPVSGHLPFAVDLREASDLGMDCIEHAHFPALACGAEYEPWRQAYADFVAKKANVPRPSLARLEWEICSSFQEELCRELAQTLARNNTYLCPTHTTRKMDAFADDRNYVADPRRKFIPANRLSLWDRDLAGTAAMAAHFREGYRKFYELGLRATGLAHQHGVRILVGTDCLDTQVFPGFSYHDEMEHLHQAGLSNLAILKAATIHSAEFLKLDDKYGSISPGKIADMIVLGSDPLVEIGNVRNIESIVFNGRVRQREELQAMLDAVIGFAGRTSDQETLWNAVIRSDINEALAAVKKGADLNELDTRNNPNGRRALNYAAERNEAEMIRALVQAGAQVDLANKTGYTALHHAAETGSNEAAKVLLELGADATRKTSRGQTPRQIAESRGMAGVVKILQAR